MRFQSAGIALVLLACVNGCGSDDPKGTGGAGGGTGASGAGGAGNGPATGPASGGAGGDGGGAGGATGECSSDEQCAEKLDNVQPPDCVLARCVAATQTCTFDAVDADGDGYKTNNCSALGADVVVGDDCDDGDATRYPGAWDGPEQTTSGKPDSCNETDNDCDGTADDDNADGASCLCDPLTDIDVPCFERPDGTPIAFPGGSPQGSCAAGTKQCDAGVWSACQGAIEPAAADQCAPGNDDTCDGAPNTGCPCLAGDVSTCAAVFGAQGVCGQATITCDATGNWPSACPVQPSAEICNQNGVDEDCDGNANNGCGCLAGQTTPCGACSQGSATCDSTGHYGSCSNPNAGQATYYRDQDGDGYCNKQNSTVACGQPAGYLSASCPNDCKDTNGWATNSCSYGFQSGNWSKHWVGFGACENHTFSVCGVGFHVDSCFSNKVSGGGNHSVWGWSGQTCTLRVCDVGFESATVYATGNCVAD